MQSSDFQFKILALAPFTAQPDESAQIRPMAVDRHCLDDCMRALNIEFYLALDAHLCRSGGISFRFDNFKSLHPDGLAKTNPFFIQLTQAEDFLAESRKKGRSSDDIAAGMAQWPDLPAIAIRADTAAPAATPQARHDSTVDSILDMVALPDAKPDGARDASAVSPSASHNEADQIRGLQQTITAALFDQPEFRQMEAAWRGLRLLLQQGIPEGTVKVELAPVHPETLSSAMASLTPHLIDDPPGLILLDMPLDSSPLSFERMTQIAQWAETLMVPVAAWTPAGFFQIDRWQALEGLPYLPNHLSAPSYAKFQTLKASNAGHWLCLCANRFLIRYPYGKDNRVRKIAFNEDKPLWVAPVWGLGTLVARSTDISGWPTRFTDRQQYHLQDLALDTQGHTPPVVVESVLNRDRLDQFNQSGLTPLATQPGTDSAFLTKAVTTAGTPLAFQLMVNRITAFVLWCKDNLPAEHSPGALETQLRLAFQVFSERSRPPAFDAIDITAKQPDGEGRIPVHLALTPSPSILPGSRPIELSLSW